jgi:hypothetical protein
MYPYENEDAIKQHVARQVYSKLALLQQTADFVFKRTDLAPWEHLGITPQDWQAKVINPLKKYSTGPFPPETANLTEIMYWLGKYRINVTSHATPFPADMQILLNQIEKDS